ncbi:hypothetical protein [Curvibacter gracilis]|uniref:hypothetical protein n=1 Tax=Curvibacter gracilis TaxID=230310 RepID=UPI0012F90487|nr:hypothetical protein [Curvibacter gracilis]
MTNQHLARLLLKTRGLPSTDRPAWRKLCEAHAQACQASQQAERSLQAEVRTLQDILTPEPARPPVETTLGLHEPLMAAIDPTLNPH